MCHSSPSMLLQHHKLLHYQSYLFHSRRYKLPILTKVLPSGSHKRRGPFFCTIPRRQSKNKSIPCLEYKSSFRTRMTPSPSGLLFHQCLHSQELKRRSTCSLRRSRRDHRPTTSTILSHMCTCEGLSLLNMKMRSRLPPNKCKCKTHRNRNSSTQNSILNKYHLYH